MQEFTVQRLQDEHFELLVPLYKKAFSKLITADFLRKKFDTTSICGIKNIGFLAIDEQGNAAAFYGAFPCFASNGSHDVLVAQSGDTMVDPQHRRKKLFVQLALATFDLCKSEGVAAIFGFPNIYSFPSFVKKLSWTHIHNIHAYHKKVKCLPFLRLTQRIRFLNPLVKSLQVYLLNRKSADGHQFQSILENRSHYTLTKSANFLHYKSSDTTKQFIKLAGVKVWLKPSPMFLLVGDIEACDEAKFKVILAALEKLAFWMGIPHLRFQASHDTKLIALVSKHLEKLDNEYPVGALALEDFDISMLRFVMSDNDTF